MILVYLESAGDRLPKTALVVIRAALEAKQTFKISKAIGVLIGSAGVEKAAEEAAQYGLDEVCFVKGDQYQNYLALPYAAALGAVAKEVSPTLVVGASTSRGKDLFPRIAQALAAGQASDVMAFNADGTFRRPMYAGNIIADVEIRTPVKVATVRTTAFDPAPKVASRCAVKEIAAPSSATLGQEFVSFETVKSERPELTEAEIVISGGRALKSAENFEKLISPLADVLGAAIGASRAAVDSGYAPNDWQVGQTGKIVAPALYIAIGISGAIQHLAGMKDSKVIVAINQDGEAPIFEIADYGLVGDLFQILPEFTDLLRKARS